MPNANEKIKKNVDPHLARDRILAAAREVFAEQGYTAASISKIAKKANVLSGSIYWAFESKERLFAEVLTITAEEWRRKFKPFSDQKTDPYEKLMVFASGFVQAPEFLRLMMIVATEHQASRHEIRDAAVKIRREWRDYVERSVAPLLEGYESDGAKRLAQRMGRMLLQLLDGVFMSLQIEQNEMTAEQMFIDVSGVLRREFEFGLSQLNR
ncbi:AcrR family transcriptional regulator [Paraburkholderia sp. MM5496-R1]|uniref:Transcriptional regulator, TetR family n=1 Tax=Paraburkholderia tuberum TaxID=157910 RepID=A0A1H1JGD6_9BURK|nr:TetR/AcrR family transcriptional regulator [Paraburkholderia tuberum]SDR48797.1 transcriptional regulator, TetR family [Paraburkholderia tuberum]